MITATNIGSIQIVERMYGQFMFSIGGDRLVRVEVIFDVIVLEMIGET